MIQFIDYQFFMRKKLQIFTLFAALILANCQGQNPKPIDPPLPLEKFKKLAFEPPAPDILAALKIPFLDGEKYGFADAEGKILLEPQFDEIEWPEWDLPVFKAKKGKNWAFYDFNGRQALSFSANDRHGLAVGFERKGFRFDENGNHIELLISKIFGLDKSTFSDPSGATKSAKQYYFLKPKTRQPFRSWFVPDHQHFIQTTRDRWVPHIFTSDFHLENLKVMDEKGRFGLLDRDGNLLQTPVRNCATIGSEEKILILDDRDRVALRDAERGWQTDFLFSTVESTPIKGLFLGKILENGQPTRLFSIDSMGRVAPIEGQSELEWLEKLPKNLFRKSSGMAPLSNQFQILTDTAASVLMDTRMKKELLRIAHGRIEWAGGGLFQVKKDKKKGWADSTGRLLLPIEFDQLVSIWPDRRLIGIKNGLHGLFDADSGRELLPPEFPYLARITRTFGRGSGFSIRSGKDWIFATKNLEIVGQEGPNAPIKLSDFQLPENVPTAARADFEKAVLPEIFNSIIPIKGPNWLHLFRSDGQHIVSIEMGAGTVEPVFFHRNEHLLDEANEFYTGFAKVGPTWPAKPFFVRLSDGKVFKK